uniref:Uncharacterized protein n=1 Tax=Coccidioides posadasii RMSCC 3488 TaxID=454284 RepID=A0A0J6FCF5_COCPO|nr:hypothetical protein CPAG_03311 [Coccidioides posadasii RMSCC 3488]
MNAGFPVPSWASTASACDGLVVAEPGNGFTCFLINFGVSAESKLVDTSLRGSTCPKGLEDDIGNTLRGYDIPTHNCSCLCWRKDAPLRNADVDRAQAPLVQRNVQIHHAVESIDNRGMSNGNCCVPVAVHLGTGIRTCRLLTFGNRNIPEKVKIRDESPDIRGGNHERTVRLVTQNPRPTENRLFYIGGTRKQRSCIGIPSFLFVHQHDSTATRFTSSKGGSTLNHKALRHAAGRMASPEILLLSSIFRSMPLVHAVI